MRAPSALLRRLTPWAPARAGLAAALLLGCASAPPPGPTATTAASNPTAGAPAPTAGARPGALVFTHTTGFRHKSIEAAAAALGEALTASGFSVETSADPAAFTPTHLGRLALVVLVSTTGKPLGDPGAEALAALDGFVRAGGGLVGVHAASSTAYDPALAYTTLIGGKFVKHPGSVRPANCFREGAHPSVARLPATFVVRDEIYTFSHLRPDNEVVLRCEAFESPERLPIAWHRREGRGRIFYTALGHEIADWTPSGVLVRDHVLPGALWAAGR